MTARYSDQHTNEVDNLAAINDRKHYTFNLALLEYREHGRFWDILDQLGLSLAVSREYEHFVILLSAPSGKPLQSVLPLPHPSGLWFDEARRELIVSSTRTPNILFWMRMLEGPDMVSDILPPDLLHSEGGLFLPYRSLFLPGTLYIHEIAQIENILVATATGHNFLAKLNPMGGWERMWWPKPADQTGFRENFFQLNGLAAGDVLERSYFTGFSDVSDGPQPWKKGYGPKGKGVIFSAATRQAMCRGLTCPHSPRLAADVLWVCNSGEGTLCRVEDFQSHSSSEVRAAPVARFSGFTRGLAFSGKYAFVGLSRVIASYELYAPGVVPDTSQCGIAIFDTEIGQTVATLEWPNGYQIFDIQILPGIRRAEFPFAPGRPGEINQALRYLG